MTPVASKQQQAADIQAVLQQAFMHPKMNRFLDWSHQHYRIFRYEELPVYNGHPLPKPKFDVAIANQTPFKYSAYRREEINNPLILVSQVIIDHDSATVNLVIPKQSVYSSFRLSKSATGAWQVATVSVGQE